jgi:hypothetical protein
MLVGTIMRSSSNIVSISLFRFSNRQIHYAFNLKLNITSKQGEFIRNGFDVIQFFCSAGCVALYTNQARKKTSFLFTFYFLGGEENEK